MFLDHMMPGKDGIELLHDLRALDDPNKNTPAVCLTANAISGAREKYISEGFDDYLTKPIDTEKLEELFCLYLPAEKLKEPLSFEEKAEELPEQLLKLNDSPDIDIETGLENSGTAKAYLSVLQICCSTIDEKAEELEHFYKERDIKNYTIRVHALKSSAMIIGAKELGEKARHLENAGKQNDAAYIKKNHKEFVSLFLNFKEILKDVAEGS